MLDRINSRLNHEIDQKKVDPDDIKDLVGDNSKLIKEFNWHTKYDISTSIKDLVKEIDL